MSARAAKCVERSREVAIREAEDDVRGREPRTLSPHRQMNRAPVPVCTATAQDDLAAVAALVVVRIRHNRYATNAGSFVLATNEGRVFVLKEHGPTTAALIDAHPADLVGLYAANSRDGRRGRCPDADRILGDLLDHFSQQGGVIPA